MYILIYSQSNVCVFLDLMITSKFRQVADCNASFVNYIWTKVISVDERVMKTIRE